MKTIKPREFEQFVQDNEIIRSEKHGYYFYELYKSVHNDEDFFTVTRYNGFVLVQKIGEINPQIPKDQQLLDFVNDQAVIHINPDKYIWKWRD